MKRDPAPRDREYLGWKERGEGGPGTVRIQHPDGRREALDPRHDLRNHSPDGFQWGYGGSGPAQLALALVADATGDDALAQRVYQSFKFKTVAGWAASWRISAGEIVDLAHELDKERVT